MTTPAVRPDRLPLLELTLDDFLEGGSKAANVNATPKSKFPKPSSSSKKRARSPTPSSSQASASSSSAPAPPPPPENWLSPSKRRVLFAEGLLSPERARTPATRRFTRPSHGADDDLVDGPTSFNDSPIRRLLFSAGSSGGSASTPGSTTSQQNWGFMGAFTRDRDRDSATPAGGVPSKATPRPAATKSARVLSFVTDDGSDGKTMVHEGNASTLLSSPATLAPSTPTQSKLLQAGLAPAFETKPASSSSSSLAKNKSIIINSKSSSSSSSSIPSIYSSNREVPLDDPQLKFERPSLEHSMTLVEGSRHYPGFIVRQDTPPSRARSEKERERLSRSMISSSSSSSSSSGGMHPPSSPLMAAHHAIASDIDDEDEDKENALVVTARKSSSTKGKRKKDHSSFGLSSSPRIGSPSPTKLKDLPEEDEGEDPSSSSRSSSSKFNTNTIDPTLITPKAKRFRTSHSGPPVHQLFTVTSTSTPLPTLPSIPNTAPPACAALRLLRTPSTPPLVPTPHPHTNLKARARASAAAAGVGMRARPSISAIRLGPVGSERDEGVGVNVGAGAGVGVSPSKRQMQTQMMVDRRGEGRRKLEMEVNES